MPMDRWAACPRGHHTWGRGQAGLGEWAEGQGQVRSSSQSTRGTPGSVQDAESGDTHQFAPRFSKVYDATGHHRRMPLLGGASRRAGRLFLREAVSVFLSPRLVNHM